MSSNSKYITSIAHINLTVPPQTLHLADCFYRDTLGLIRVQVPEGQRDTLAWYDLSPGGQQIHIAFPAPSSPSSPTKTDELSYPTSRRHPCFKIPTAELLLELQGRIWEHFLAGQGQSQGEGKKDAGDEGVRKASAPREADKPGERNSG